MKLKITETNPYKEYYLTSYISSIINFKDNFLILKNKGKSRWYNTIEFDYKLWGTELLILR